MTVATAQACANLAFVKYWGKRDASLNLPLNNSISMTLDGARTTTTVRFSAGLARDTVTLAGSNAVPAFAARVSAAARAAFRASMSGRRVIPGSGESPGLSLVNC